MNNRFFPLIAILLALLTFSCSSNKQQRESFTNDTIYTEAKAMSLHVTEPERALMLIDSAVIAGNITWERGEYLKAVTQYSGLKNSPLARQTCIDLLAKSPSDSNTVENIYTLLTAIEYSQGNYATTVRYATEASRLAHTLNLPNDIGNMKGYIAHVMAETGKTDEGIQQLQATINELRQMNSFNGVTAYHSTAKKLLHILIDNNRFAEMVPVCEAMLERIDELEFHPELFSGIPDGFSVIWTAMLPSFGLLMFGMRYGTIISLFMFLALVFFFWIPFGQGLLQYQYDATFMLRFPLLYLAFFTVAFLLERMRELSHKALIESREKYEFLCYHDALTGLYNRFWLQTVQAHPEKYHIKPAAIGILDIDNFKFINDNFGHPNGDIVIQRMGQSITNTLHGSGDLCRWGGDEFLILFHTDIDAETVCKRIVDEVRACVFVFDGERMGTTVSVGLAIAPNGSTDDIDALIHQADVNLYLAKDEGKNCTISSELKA